MQHKAIIYIFCACALIGCTKASTKEVSSQCDSILDTTQILVDTILPDVVEGVSSYEEAKADCQSLVEPSHRSSTGSFSYNSSNYENSEVYWEDKRKHSPNDNYLLGFDEDVDDVHDMELYMDDY